MVNIPLELGDGALRSGGVAHIQEGDGQGDGHGGGQRARQGALAVERGGHRQTGQEGRDLGQNDQEEEEPRQIFENNEENFVDDQSATAAAAALSSSVMPGGRRTYQEISTEFARDYLVDKQSSYKDMVASQVVNMIRVNYKSCK